jgi:hypothetical protein
MKLLKGSLAVDRGSLFSPICSLLGNVQRFTITVLGHKKKNLWELNFHKKKLELMHRKTNRKLVQCNVIVPNGFNQSFDFTDCVGDPAGISSGSRIFLFKNGGLGVHF